MFKKNLRVLGLSALVLVAAVAAFGQGSVSVGNSEVTAAAMPAGAERLTPESIPAEFNQAFDNLLAQGEGKIVGGQREILAWAGNYGTAAKSGKFEAQVQANLRSAGWQYEAQGRSGDLEIFSLLKDGSPRRVVLGFFVPDDRVIVCALMEVVRPGASVTQLASAKQRPSANADPSARVINAAKDDLYINLMGDEMPAMPQFPALQRKAGHVRGYVKDWTGKPLAGAAIGVRSSYLAGYYTGAQGTTDANGYYEFVVPKGSAHFYNAGYQIEWGDGGVAALGLHPADGKLESFVTMDGAVENFVLLPYGITSRENAQQNPTLASTYYGGAIHLSYYTVEADDNNAPPFAVRQDSTLEITLTPDDGSGKAIVIRKTIGPAGRFSINNIPIARYKMTIRIGGKAVKLKDNKKYNPQFGMSPVESVGTATVIFSPDEAKASMVSPQAGGWKSVEIGISTQ
jgi:hypothetical protein